jgi:hypothetical protein
LKSDALQVSLGVRENPEDFAASFCDTDAIVTRPKVWKDCLQPNFRKLSEKACKRLKKRFFV